MSTPMCYGLQKKALLLEITDAVAFYNPGGLRCPEIFFENSSLKPQLHTVTNFISSIHN